MICCVMTYDTYTYMVCSLLLFNLTILNEIPFSYAQLDLFPFCAHHNTEKIRISGPDNRVYMLYIICISLQSCCIRWANIFFPLHCISYVWMEQAIKHISRCMHYNAFTSLSCRCSVLVLSNLSSPRNSMRLICFTLAAPSASSIIHFARMMGESERGLDSRTGYEFNLWIDLLTFIWCECDVMSCAVLRMVNLSFCSVRFDYYICIHVYVLSTGYMQNVCTGLYYYIYLLNHDMRMMAKLENKFPEIDYFAEYWILLITSVRVSGIHFFSVLHFMFIHFHWNNKILKILEYVYMN